MALNQKCPKCGSTHVQLSNVESKHGCLWFILFGWLFLFWVMSGKASVGSPVERKFTIATIVPIILRVNKHPLRIISAGGVY